MNDEEVLMIFVFEYKPGWCDNENIVEQKTYMLQCCRQKKEQKFLSCNDDEETIK